LRAVLNAELNENTVSSADPSEYLLKYSIFTILGVDAVFEITEIVGLPFQQGQFS